LPSPATTTVTAASTLFLPLAVNLAASPTTLPTSSHSTGRLMESASSSSPAKSDKDKDKKVAEKDKPRDKEKDKDKDKDAEKKKEEPPKSRRSARHRSPTRSQGRSQRPRRPAGKSRRSRHGSSQEESSACDAAASRFPQLPPTEHKLTLSGSLACRAAVLLCPAPVEADTQQQL